MTVKTTITSASKEKNRRGEGDNNNIQNSDLTPIAIDMEREQPPQSSTKSQQPTFTVHFSEPLTEMNPISSSDFLHTLLTPQDIKVLSNYSLEQLKQFRSQNLVQLVAIEGAFSERASILAKKEKELSEATEVLAETQARLQESEMISQERLSKLDKTLNELNVITTLNQKLAADNEDLKKRVSEISSRAQIQAEQYFRDLKASIDHQLTEAHDSGVREGVRSCRQRLLYTLQGQHFLQTMHQDLLEAYHLSTDYLRHLGPPVTWLTTKICVTLAATLKIDLKVIVDHVNKIVLKDLPAPPSFKGSETQPKGFAWWLPTMRKAARILAFEGDMSPSLPHVGVLQYPVLDSPIDSVGDAARSDSGDTSSEVPQQSADLRPPKKTRLLEHILGSA